MTLGFVVWRLAYLGPEERHNEPDGDPARAASLARGRVVARMLTPLVGLAVPVAIALDHLAHLPVARWTLIVAASVLVGALLVGVDRVVAARVAMAAALVALLGWAAGGAGVGVAGVVRGLHLVAFGLWLGGAAWNLTVAVPIGMRHPSPAAVESGARQLQRFRRVARAAVPTVIATGVLMALPYLDTAGDLVATAPGRYVVAKAGLIVALVVIFIVCPLYRQCSPVAGVCERPSGGPRTGHGGE